MMQKQYTINNILWSSWPDPTAKSCPLDDNICGGITDI